LTPDQVGGQFKLFGFGLFRTTPDISQEAVARSVVGNAAAFFILTQKYRWN